MTARSLLALALAPGALLLGACAETRSSTEIAVPTPATPTARYPVTMRADLARAEGVPTTPPDDAFSHIGLWTSGGEELMSGLFDRSSNTFVEGSIYLLGMLPEEMETLDLGSLDERIEETEASFLLSCADPEVRWLFLDAQGSTSDAEATGRQQLLLAFGGIVAFLREREVSSVPIQAGADPCVPLEDKDFCTWSPEFYQAACCAHDECYASCLASGTTREQCDLAFREGMAAEATVWTLSFVPTYYAAVRAFGAEFFPCR